MPAERRSFVRDDPDARRAALIGAVLELMADGGPQAVTVRAIAERAGVTQGMIRHYFTSKEDLVNAAYQAHMAAQMEATEAAMPETGWAAERLRHVIAASLTPPVADARTLSLWAGFIHMIRRDTAMRATHEASYLAFRNALQALITEVMAEAGRPVDASAARRLAIACNAVLDGLWLEGGALPDAFAAGEVVEIGLASVRAILGIELGGEG
jgi:AcrR family transcriptional regulator